MRVWKDYNNNTPKAKAMDGDSCVVKEKPATHHRPPSMADNRTNRSYVVYVGSLLVTYNVLVQILRLKYKGKDKTPFDTQSFLIRTSILAFFVCGMTLPILIYDYLSKSTKRQFSPVFYRIMKVVCSVTGVVAHISLVLILIID